MNDNITQSYVHVVALAVADGVKAVVEQSVLHRECADRVSAAVVLLAAAVRRDDVAVRLPVRRRHVARPAPTSTGHDQPHAPTTSSSAGSIVVVLTFRLECFTTVPAAGDQHRRDQEYQK